LAFSSSLLDAHSKKDQRRIHWADTSGQALAIAEEVKAGAIPKKAEPEKVRQSRWAERKKKDFQHEKDLLLQSRQVFR